MKHLVLAFCLLVLPAWAADDPVIAQRGQDQITVGQARALIASADPASQHRLATDQAALKTFLRDVLLQRAVLEQAEMEHWAQRPEIATLLQRARDRMVADSFLAGHAALPAGFPSDADIQAAYDQNRSRLMQPRGYHLLQLYLPNTAGGSADESRRKLVLLRGQMQHGRTGFEDAARHGLGVQFSDVGWVSEPQLTPAARNAVAGLPKGSVSDPLCSESGCRVVKLVATRQAGPASLADARETLIGALKQQKQAELERAYESGLLARQPVAINEIQLAHVVP
jgi:peptidylprolyl isomerase